MSNFAPMFSDSDRQFPVKPRRRGGRKGHPDLKRVLVSAAFCAMVVFYLWLYISVFKFELPGTVFLKKKNAEWLSRIEILDRQLDIYDHTLRGIEERDDNVYRSIFGLETISDEVKQSGLSGRNRYEKYKAGGANPVLANTVRRLDRLAKRASVQSKSFDEIAGLARDAGSMVSCVPGIPPICPSPGQFHLSSRFGGREDPVRGGRRFHSGVDFAARKGFPVYATGDGTIRKVSTKFSGYGNEIIIDHGFGYTTRYAHLSLIEVTVGMKVRRGERIGAVGSSGRSTGPHLHYEVIYKNRPVNPLNYMDLAIKTPEFQAMVGQREGEARRTHRTSTSELLRRRRTGR